MNSALHDELRKAPLTVWATLKEDTYESSLGDGYYAYLDEVFARPSEAAAQVEALEADPDNGWFRWHIRRYQLRLSGDGDVTVRPAPTEQEPTTAASLVERLVAKSGPAGIETVEWP